MHISKKLILAVGLAVLFAVPLAGRAQALTSNWQKGVVIQSRFPDDFAGAPFKQSIDKLAADGVNYVSLSIQLNQSNIYSTDVQPGNGTPSDQALTAGVSYIHSKGMKVALNMRVDPQDGQWRAFVNPGDRAGWFMNYGNYVSKYATFSQANGVEQLVLGTELSSMTNQSVNNSNTSRWQQIVQKTRTQYKGQLGYCAQHAGYMQEDVTFELWSQLDFIGLSAYYALPNGDTPSVSDIKNSWANWNNNVVAPLAQKYNKPVIFCELGYTSRSGSLGDPGASYNLGAGVNMQVQANAYQALYEFWNNQSHMNGVFWWDWSSDPAAGGTNNRDYTPQGKPAEQIMKQWFSAGGSGNGGGTPSQPTTPTTPTTPAPPSAPTSGYSATATAPSPAVVNAPVSIVAKVSAQSTAPNALVDLEVYNTAGQKVAQTYSESQTLNTGGTNYTITWTPTQAGTYTLKVGVFTAGWQNTLLWNDAVLSFQVAAAQASNQPTPPVTAPTTPTNPAAPTVPMTGNVSVWWPGEGVSVSGMQPFKAVLDGVPLGQYTMYWQVGDGQLNAMGDVTSGAAHKEANVNLSGWRWSGDGKYVITFVAKNSSGAIIAKKSVTIHVS